MSCELALIQYASAMLDGYPWRWHRAGEACPAIKDFVREQTGHRCQRCLHPYAKGEHPLQESHGGAMESWSLCDELCRHGGPYRLREAALGGTWVEYRIGDGLPFPSEAMFEDGPGGQRIKRWEYEALWRVLTVHHLDEDKLNCRWWNLAALCQRCHLRMQRAVVMGRPYHFEHSDWFKPHAAGFYAWKYLGEDLDREATMARLDELLALEHRFTQEALL